MQLLNAKRDEKLTLLQIDTKLSFWAGKLLTSLKIGTEPKINYISFESLVLLRDIFVAKQNNADWLCQYDINQIESAIRQYTKINC